MENEIKSMHDVRTLMQASGIISRIAPKDFEPITAQDILNVLGVTIKQDNQNKLVTFLCALSAYTDSSQLNVSFNAPSSTGKTFIPLEIAKFFPEEDVVSVGYCSPTAFFHDVGIMDKERGAYIVDLSHKILIFLDQPHTLLLQHLRPLLSHDKKEIDIKITDKAEKHGLRTKAVILKGFPVVIFCTAGLDIDEQESTRFLLLSPEINNEKIREAVMQKILKESDNAAYKIRLEDNTQRNCLIKRIRAIKQENVMDVRILHPEAIGDRFLGNKQVLKPRYQRDIGRIMCLIKAIALLNVWFRQREGSIIIADDDDVDAAFELWGGVFESQDYNLPPYIYSLYKDVILGGFTKQALERGITRQEILGKYQELYGRPISEFVLRTQVLPMIENAGLIFTEKDPRDSRKILVHLPTVFYHSKPQNNRELGGGVNDNVVPGDLVN